jgi:hypothetical protein
VLAIMEEKKSSQEEMRAVVKTNQEEMKKPFK